MSREYGWLSPLTPEMKAWIGERERCLVVPIIEVQAMQPNQVPYWYCDPDPEDTVPPPAPYGMLPSTKPIPRFSVGDKLNDRKCPKCLNTGKVVIKELEPNIVALCKLCGKEEIIP